MKKIAKRVFKKITLEKIKKLANIYILQIMIKISY